MRGKPISSEIPATAMTQPEVVQASVHTTRDSLDQEPLDSLPEAVAPLQYSPLSTATSVSSSSASVVSSSDSSDEGDIAHRAYNADLYSRTNSLGLMDEFADEQAFQSQLSNLQRRQPFSYEDDSQGVSREKTPRTFDTTPSINSVDEQGLLVPSSLGSSTSTSDTEFDDPGNDPMQFGVTHAGGTILAPRQTEDKHTTTEMESAASAETVLLGSPVQT
ncbi:hypothetical protein QFC19_000769 [Naganishia cerealis]|uniref:Uncharacterized protein n=1 Tax=Naganishia cerealis TaxID=610337 RepID=A0ACC2WMG3_9TREE|nr:hypothetical protein QFC19_000769 [Naganishia cerealis]